LRIYRAVLGVVLDEPTAEDLTQETFERAYRTRTQYRRTAPVGAWLHRIAINLAISHVRRRDLAHQLPFRLFVRGGSSDFDRVEDRTLTRRALAALRPRHRAVIVLHFYADMTREEIAAILGVPEGTVASRLASAMELMRRTLARAGRELSGNDRTDGRP
jgi:RNA polymerase sigma-70 factor (ECF subfamily)